MHITSIISYLTIGLLFVASSLCQGDLFKINKLNLVWTKAQHSLGPTKLKDLREDLAKHEADELSLKKLKAHNQDKDGLMEASVRKKLLVILSKYSLERYLNDIANTPQAPGSETAPSKIPDLPTFRDSKLDKLWKKAEKAGFDQEQLMVLHEEFQHQQDKLDDHYETLNMIEQEIDRSASESGENSIEVPIDTDGKKKKMKHEKKSKETNENESEKKARLSINLHQGLKEKHNEIKKSIDYLSKKIASGAIDGTTLFKEERVNELWTTALQSNFSTDELKSLKEELVHYETRIEKLKHFQNQLERHEIGAKSSQSYGEHDKEVKHIKKKVKELSQKVDKTEKTIKKKILREEL